MPALMIQAPDQASPALHAALYAEWQKFRDGTAPVDPEYIPPFILASWERCRESGITTEANSIVRVDALLLEQAQRLNSDLLCSARSIMDKLFSVVRATRCSISLTDGSGLVLHTLRSEGDGPDVLPGQIATEAVSGTNGIGTCLVERKTVTIIGAQHYCARHHVWSCTASPIRYEDGTLAGVLNVSIARESYHLHTRGMVEASAHAIAEQLHLRAALGRQRAIMEVLDEGILEVGASGEIHSANGRGLSMLGLEALLSEAVRRDILDEHNAFQDREALLHTANGTLPCVLSFAPLGMGKGGVLALRESRRLCGFAARTIGAGAVYALDDIPGDSPAIAQAREALRRAARHDAPVLLTGEEGTERHGFAQAIHNAGRRREAPFVAVHCGGIPRSLMRSELFGFDGEGGRPGKCELADGGTLFLDGVEALPLTAQMGIVRLLRGGETARVGGGQGRTVNVRLIAGAGPGLSEAVREGLFLKELHELLREYTITVPPLRERRSDIEALAARCASRFAQALGKQPKPIAPEAMEALLRYSWPGNVRELETVLERAVALAEGDVIGLSDLHARISAAEVSAPTGKPLPGHEAKRLLAALERTAGNVREAAKLLGISRGGFYVKLKKLGLNPDEYR
ncbi:sigma 54-interacting transcriptional regulator [uncultured Bilophila sp.]|uniref:sigma-54-dependent Fis family transcriptional regulator n=1 Tax=uncultured Bilophila sp. TaxID=529385 RepID=UPI002591310A|nr:sigma 54-interacting transcriptional regulator [uncultured Bilophila sp.]